MRVEDAASPEDALAAAAEDDPKCLPLCAQARRALEHAIGVECRDERLNQLHVMDVWPDPTTRRLRVWVVAPEPLAPEERENVIARLRAARGFLRVQLALAIHRKRTPELVFELLAAEPPEREAR
ncbi:MAG: ribosome-binding factor A [Myxococcota bacterium]